LTPHPPIVCALLIDTLVKLAKTHPSTTREAHGIRTPRSITQDYLRLSTAARRSVPESRGSAKGFS
ncbi:MAG: hypothetical protein VYA82_05745, partial [Pseudomonadota bacterium]|nr:hypothetical protein [Pseudomonadota bacterium]